MQELNTFEIKYLKPGKDTGQCAFWYLKFDISLKPIREHFFWYFFVSIYSTLSDAVDRYGVPLIRDFKVKEQILS